MNDIDTALSAGDSSAHDIAFGLFFGGLGFSQNVIYVAAALIMGTVPTGPDVALALLCVGCICGGIAKFTEYRRDKKTIDAVRNRLKQRKLRTIYPNLSGGGPP